MTAAINDTAMICVVNAAPLTVPKGPIAKRVSGNLLPNIGPFLR